MYSNRTVITDQPFSIVIVHVYIDYSTYQVTCVLIHIITIVGHQLSSVNSDQANHSNRTVYTVLSTDEIYYSRLLT